MKNFFDLLATDLRLDICVNNNKYQAGIRDTLEFDADDTVIVDGYEVLPRYQYLAENGVLKINEPFYCWYHRASGQGWLLNPY
jgi:hypothetical protein